MASDKSKKKSAGETAFTSQVVSEVKVTRAKSTKTPIDETPDKSAPSDLPAMTPPLDAKVPVDHWFDRQLLNLYGEVADEPVPPEILDLVQKLKTPH